MDIKEKEFKSDLFDDESDEDLTYLEKFLRHIHFHSHKWSIELAIRTFFGRLFHGGISKSDLWSLDLFLSPKIAKAVKRFAEIDKHGVPAYIVGDGDVDDYVEVWDAILWKIVDGFERMSGDDFCVSIDTIYEDEALELFYNFFNAMWD